MKTVPCLHTIKHRKSFQGEGQTKGTDASLPPNEWDYSEFERNVHHEE